MQLKMLHMSCRAKFRIFEPVEECRSSCPFIFVISKGPHPHPIPLPQKTPPVIRTELFRLLESLDDDLADLTPRRLLRHPVIKAYLANRFPASSVPPTLSNLHVSLANRSHLRAYINQVKGSRFPHGTGWEGLDIFCTSLRVN
jgi:hypothetical protein